MLFRRWSCALLVLVVANAWTTLAQSRQGQEPSGGRDQATLTTQLVKTGLFVLAGGGAPSGVGRSANGRVVGGGMRPGNYSGLMSQVRGISRISDLPLRFLILTNHHEDRTGDLQQFASAGVRLVAQQNVARRLAIAKPDATASTPLRIAFDRERTIRLGGIDVQLLHFGNASTNADSVAYFTNLKVVAVGDLFTASPHPDFAAGGSLVNWPAVIAETLKLDFDVVVPSTGPLVSRRDLEAFKNKLDAVVSRAKALVKNGVPATELMSQLKTDDLGWRLDFSGAHLDALYAELSRTK